MSAQETAVPDLELDVLDDKEKNLSVTLDDFNLGLPPNHSSDNLDDIDPEDYGYTKSDEIKYSLNYGGPEKQDAPKMLKDMTAFLGAYKNDPNTKNVAKANVNPIVSKYPSLNQNPLSGPFALTCTTAPQYKDKCARMLNRTAAFYNFNSRGKVHMYYTDRKPRGVPGRNVNVDPRRHHNSAGHLCQFLLSVSAHELGHQIGFGHIKMIARKPCGKKRCDHYPLLDSVMNPRAIMATKYLNTPEYYHKDWLEPTEYAIHDFPAGTTKEYTLYRTDDFSNRELKAVIIPSEVIPKVIPAAQDTPTTQGDVSIEKHKNKGDSLLRPLFFSWPSHGFCAKGEDKCVRTYIKVGGGVLGASLLDSKTPVADNFMGFKLEYFDTNNANTVGLRVQMLDTQKANAPRPK